MYKDIISYRLADGVTHEQLLDVAQRIIDAWMRDLDGFVSREILQGSDGQYTDIVTWESPDVAHAAERAMQSIPNAAERYECYDASTISSSGMTLLATFA